MVSAKDKALANHRQSCALINVSEKIPYTDEYHRNYRDKEGAEMKFVEHCCGEKYKFLLEWCSTQHEKLGRSLVNFCGDLIYPLGPRETSFVPSKFGQQETLVPQVIIAGHFNLDARKIYYLSLEPPIYFFCLRFKISSVHFQIVDEYQKFFEQQIKLLKL